MNLIEKLFGGLKGDGFNQRQREALVDLLILCQYADNILKLSEEEEMHAKLESLKWESSKPLTYYINEAVSRVRDARASPEAQSQFIHFISERLEESAARKRAWEFVQSVFYADRSKSAREIAMGNQIKSVFGVK